MMANLWPIRTLVPPGDLHIVSDVCICTHINNGLIMNRDLLGNFMGETFVGHLNLAMLFPQEISLLIMFRLV